MTTAIATRSLSTFEVPKEIVSASAWKEAGFGLRNCMAVATVAAAVAAASFAMQWPIAPLCTAIAVWGVFSATVIGLHRVTEGTLVGRAVRHLYAVVMEQNATIVAITLSPLAFFKKYHDAAGSENKQRPILLLNGFLGCGSNLHFLRKRLQAKGHGPIYTVNVPWGVKSIQDKAEMLKETVQQIQKETGRDDLIIAGHSMGGLVGSYFATHKAKEIGSKVTDVITIGSPLQGTPFASFALLFRDGASMRPGSKLQKQIAEGIKKHPEVCFSHIASELDGTIPLNSALPEGSLPERTFLLKDLEHRSLLFSSRIADKISFWIKESLNRSESKEEIETAPGGPVIKEMGSLAASEAERSFSPLPSPSGSTGEFEAPPAFHAAMHAAVAAANVFSVGALAQGVCAAAAGMLNQNS